MCSSVTASEMLYDCGRVFNAKTGGRVDRALSSLAHQGALFFSKNWPLDVSGPGASAPLSPLVNAALPVSHVTSQSRDLSVMSSPWWLCAAVLFTPNETTHQPHHLGNQGTLPHHFL